MHDTKERLSLFWIFAFLDYLYADVLALWVIVGSPNLADAPHLSPCALAGSAVLMEIPIAMIGLVVGFRYRADAERFLREFRERLAKFGLE